MSEDTLRVFVRDAGRHRLQTGYGQLARMILLALDERSDIHVLRPEALCDWEDVPQRERIERIPIGKPTHRDIELWVGSPGLSLPESCDVPRLLFTQHALSELPPAWVRAVRRVDHLIVPGDFDRVVFERHHPSVHVCHQAVDVTVFRPRPELRQEGPSHPTFLFVGSFGYRKGADVLLRAFCRAFDPPDAELWLLCPDAGGKAFNRALTILQAHQPGARIRFFTNRLAPPKVAEMYCRVDAFVSLSRGEGWCMPAHEALLCDKPVIVSRSTAMAEALRAPFTRFVSTHPVEVASIEDEFARSLVLKYGHAGCHLYEPSEDDAIEHLRAVASARGPRATAEEGAQFVRDRYSLASMGAKLASILKGIRER